VFFESLTPVIQASNFHQREINRLDRGEPPKAAKNSAFPVFVPGLK
jgi:hypothetical protein